MFIDIHCHVCGTMVQQSLILLFVNDHDDSGIKMSVAVVTNCMNTQQSKGTALF